jgi:hypothetical protein
LAFDFAGIVAVSRAVARDASEEARLGRVLRRENAGGV